MNSLWDAYDNECACGYLSDQLHVFATMLSDADSARVPSLPSPLRPTSVCFMSGCVRCVSITPNFLKRRNPRIVPWPQQSRALSLRARRRSVSMSTCTVYMSGISTWSSSNGRPTTFHFSPHFINSILCHAARKILSSSFFHIFLSNTHVHRMYISVAIWCSDLNHTTKMKSMNHKTNVIVFVVLLVRPIPRKF
jgi:hypothetical protein